jgi:CBS domain-containing protein
MIDQSVGDVMTHAVRTVTGETTASAVARLFAENRIGSAVVVDPDTGELLGIVTESDIMRQVAADADVASTPVRSFMTAPVVTIASTDSIDTAAILMKERSIRRLPVVDGDDLVGMLTTTNLAHYLPRVRDSILRTRNEARERYGGVADRQSRSIRRR